MVCFLHLFTLFISNLSTQSLNHSENWMLGISPEGIGFIGMLLNFLTSILVSRFFQSPSEEIVELIDRVRLP